MPTLGFSLGGFISIWHVKLRNPSHIILAGLTPPIFLFPPFKKSAIPPKKKISNIHKIIAVQSSSIIKKAV